MNDFDDTTLTEAEERRFDELFSPTDRLSLTHDWKQVLHEAILEQDPGLSSPYADGTGELTDDVVSLDERRSLKAMAPRLLMAAAVAVIAVFGLSAVMNQSISTDGEVVNPPVLAPELEIGQPTFSRRELPANVVHTVASETGIVAVIQNPETDETTLFSSNDGVTWDEGSTLAVRNAVVDIVGDSWVIAGEDLETLVTLRNAGDDTFGSSIGVFRSTDGGASWERIPFDIPRSRSDYISTKTTEISVAQLDDIVLLSYLHSTVFDTTGFLVDAGVVGTNDRVIKVFNEQNDEVLFSLGPEVFGEIEVLPSDVGMTRDEYNETVDRPEWSVSEPVLAVSSDGAAFDEVASPEESFGLTPLIAVHDGKFVNVNLTVRGGSYASATVLVAYESTDGRSWDKVDTDDFDLNPIDITDDWVLRSGRDGLEQSVDGGREFDLIPAPGRGLIPISTTKTDFGVAVVWLNFDQIVALDNTVTRSVQDGYTIVFEGNDVRVADRSGVEIANQSIYETQDGPVIVSSDYQVFVLGPNGETVFASDPDWVDISEFFSETQPDQFISWSTNGSDWKFASLDGIGPGLWDYYSTDAGLVAIEGLEYDNAIIFEWPAEFVDR